MNLDWRDDQPIYRQLYRQILAGIADGSLKEGEALPSVRKLATSLQLNPVTVSRAIQLLADEQWVVKRRGLGMFVTEGARDRMKQQQRQQFLQQTWPAVLQQIHQLQLDPQPLIRQLQQLDSTPVTQRKGKTP